MPRMLKIYRDDATEFKEVAGVHVVESYPAFFIAEVDDSAAAALTASPMLTEDITDQYTLAHERGDIDTGQPRIDGRGKIHAHPAYVGARKLPSGPHHYLVQFIGPIKKPWLKEVEHCGAEVVAPWGGFAVVARMTSKVAGEVAALRAVRWVGHLPYSARLSANAGDTYGKTIDPQAPRTRYVPGSYVVQFFREDLCADARKAVETLGFKIVDEPPRSAVMIVRPEDVARTKPAKLEASLHELSRVHGVRLITPQAIRRPSNDRAALIMATGRSMGISSGATAGLGLSGEGEIVGVCDTGLDTGNPKSIHPDFAGRVKVIKSYPMAPSFAKFVNNPGADDGPADLDSGHGTHTVGSVLGSGTSSNGLSGLAGPVRGLAYNAKLVFQAVEQEIQWKDPKDALDYGRYLLAGLPADLTPVLAWAYDNGARIHSNSWGGGKRRAYDEQCEQIDRFIWEHPDFCMLIAAGNDGTDHNADGLVDEGSITPPGTAKNCITVGASENNRPEMTAVYGQWKDYPVPPIHNDRLANNPDQIAAFSSRGPTADGRNKPDVVAPGTYILSTRSRLLAANQYGYGRFGSSTLYMFDSGTSMATPLTAGAVAIIREYLRKHVKIARPSAALLKAALIAGTVILSRTATNPNNNEGFGRVNLDAILAPTAPLKATFNDDAAGLGTGTFAEMELKVRKPGFPLRVVLAYTDFPAPQLVNNLNLILLDPNDVAHVGNAPPGSKTFDAKNNVESVTVLAAASGKWRVRIVASNVPKGPQPFAWVALGAT